MLADVTNQRAKTLAEKILSRASGRDARAGDLVVVSLSRVMVHDSVVDAVIAGLRDLGREDRKSVV